MTVDIVSDVVCPWCFIGQRKLHTAIDAFRAAGHGDAIVRWHPFELNPDLPVEGIPRFEYVQRKFGGRGAEVYQRLSQAGRAVGLDFAFDRIPRQPNTRHAHALLAAVGAELQDRLATALFAAYFLDGRDLTDDAVLIDVAAAAGMDPGLATAAIADDELAQQIAGAEARAQALGVTGVPFFIFDGRVAVSGAHDPAVLLEAMREARGAATSPGA